MRPDPTTDRAAQIERLGRYKIVRPLSKGGMALVYEARRESLAGVSPRVAIKLILPEHESSETFRELFINEARLGASMHHQNLVQIQDFDCDADRYYLVMEYVEGVTLRRIITLCQRHGLQLPVGVIAEIGRQACDGLHYAHCARDEKGLHLKLVHRDIKPSNLILSPHGVVKVLDFGISKGRLRRERQGSVKGTWGYMAPEQANGESVQPTADVFGLAVVLYELASLRPMFQDKGKDEIKRLLRDDHAARMAATIDPAYAPLIPVLVRALQRDPKARYASAEELGRALSALLPDPITSRDEVTRFYDTVAALEEGKAPPARAVTRDHASQGSLLASDPSEADGAPAPAGSTGWVFGVVAAFGVAAVVLVGAVLAAMLVLGHAEPEGPPIAAGTEPSLQDVVFDEPSGPAGEGAPGELGDPSALPRERRPPRAAHTFPPAPGSAEDTDAPRIVGEQDPSGAADPAAGATVEAPSAAAGPVEEPVRIRFVRKSPEELRISQVGEQPPSGSATAPPPGEPATRRTSTGMVPTLPPPAVEGPSGVLVVDAKQEAEVYIAGQFVDVAPVRRDLPPGRYAVSIVARDGRRKSIEVEIVDGGKIRKTWDFDRMEWR